MIPYATAAEAEAALGRAMTWAEAAWYQYSAAMPDSWLHCHTTFILFVIYTITPLPLVVLEQFAPSVVLPYKLQPRVRLPLAAFLSPSASSSSPILSLLRSTIPLSYIFFSCKHGTHHISK
jgi:methylsterol monooxygenase/4,4-dimethyl-9beta,19-cyclopropylsterol-4alpha-methyl oxidase